MDTRALGSSGIEVSALCLGSWLTFEHIPRDQAGAVVAAAFDSGITFLDDARYDDRTGEAPVGSGWSELILGEILAGLAVPRDRFVLAEKLWFEFFPDESAEAELDGSLGRLGLDHIDLAYCAEPPDGLNLEDLVPALNTLVVKGKLRAWGALNWPPGLLAEAARFARAEGLAPPVAAQLPHNAIDRGFVEGPAAAAALSGSGISVVASHCLAGGLLTGKYSEPGATGRHPPERIAALAERGVLRRVEGWAETARGAGVTPAQLHLAFSLSRPHVTSVCFGARTVEQLWENAAAADLGSALAGAIADLEATTDTPVDP